MRVLERREPRHRLGSEDECRGDLARLQLQDRVGVGQMHHLHSDAERLEDEMRGDVGAASLVAEIHRFAVELLDVGNVGPGEDMDLLGEQLGDIGDLVDEVGSELAALGEISEDVGLGDAHVDAAQEHHVPDILGGALAHHGQDAQVLAVVENGRDVGGDLQVRAVGSSGHDGDDVLVQPRTIALLRALDRSRRFGLGIALRARRGRSRAGEQAQTEREGDTHDFPPRRKHTRHHSFVGRRQTAGKPHKSPQIPTNRRENPHSRMGGATQRSRMVLVPLALQ